MKNNYMLIDINYGNHAVITVDELYELGESPHNLPDNIYPLYPDLHQKYLDEEPLVE